MVSHSMGSSVVSVDFGYTVEIPFAETSLPREEALALFMGSDCVLVRLRMRNRCAKCEKSDC
eukprot:586146-Amphidinium_carterae.1